MNAYERLLRLYSPAFIPAGLGEDENENHGEKMLQEHNARYGTLNAIMIAVLLIASHSVPPPVGLVFTLLMFPHAIFLGFALRGFVSSLTHHQTEN